MPNHTSVIFNSARFVSICDREAADDGIIHRNFAEGLPKHRKVIDNTLKCPVNTRITVSTTKQCEAVADKCSCSRGNDNCWTRTLNDSHKMV